MKWQGRARRYRDARLVLSLDTATKARLVRESVRQRRGINAIVEELVAGMPPETQDQLVELSKPITEKHTMINGIRYKMQETEIAPPPLNNWLK